MDALAKNFASPLAENRGFTLNFLTIGETRELTENSLLVYT